MLLLRQNLKLGQISLKLYPHNLKSDLSQQFLYHLLLTLSHCLQLLMLYLLSSNLLDPPSCQLKRECSQQLSFHRSSQSQDPPPEERPQLQPSMSCLARESVRDSPRPFS